MRIKPGFELITMLGENVIVAHGKENINFTHVISFNESAAYLWDKVKDTDFTPDTFADLLTEEYEIDRETALADSRRLLDEWLQNGLVEE